MSAGLDFVACPQMFSPVQFSLANLSPGPLPGPFVTPSLIEGGEECPLRSGKALRGLLESALVSRFNILETKAFSSSRFLIQLPGTPGFPPFSTLVAVVRLHQYASGRSR